MLRAALPAILSLLLTAPAAHADTLTDAINVARAAWPNSPCAGHETIQIVTPNQMSAQDGRLAEAVLDGSCTVHILKLPPRQLCPVLVHEFGHLAGHQHDTSGGIMDPDGPRDWPACPAGTPGEWAAEAVNTTPADCASVTQRVFDCGRWRVTVTLSAGRPVGAMALPRRRTRRPLRHHVRDHPRHRRTPLRLGRSGTR